VNYEHVLEPLVSLNEAERIAAYLGELLGVPGVRLESLLDPAPLAATLADRIKFRQVRANVRSGALRAAAVVATSGTTNLSVVFHDGGGRHRRDVARGIDYVPAQLAERHVLASAAIPTLFPAVQVADGRADGWYFDGGTRLNTPIKPALTLGARKMIVIALNSLARQRGGATTKRKPDALDGAGQLMQGILVDPLINDVHTLATVNELLDDKHPDLVTAHERRTHRRRIPYILIAPPDPDEIAQIAAEVYRAHYRRLPKALRSPSIALLGRIVDPGASVAHGELFSYLFFAREFIERLLELGRRDARAWLGTPHDQGIWQVGPVHSH
jgi:NTE family protein